MNKTSKYKKPLLFALSLLPVGIIGGICTAYYQLGTLSADMVSDVIAQVGSLGAFIAITTLQSTLYAILFGFIGYILTRKVGLLKPFTLNKKGMVSSLLVGALIGTLLCADHFVSGSMYPEIQNVNVVSFSATGVLASVFYGGVIEEVMMRLFLMSLIVFICWKLFFRKYTSDNIPNKIYIIANIITAFAFSAGHLPATISIFGTLTPFLLIRCFLLNGMAGYLFGELFRKHGISYAMIAHATAHIAKFILFAIFL